MKVHENQGKSAARTNTLMLFLLAWFLCFAEGRSSNCVWFTVADPWVKINKPGEYNDEMSWWGSDVHNTSSQQVPQEVLDLFLPKNRLSQVVWLGFSGVYSKEFGNPPRGKARPPSCALHWNLVVLVGKKLVLNFETSPVLANVSHSATRNHCEEHIPTPVIHFIIYWRCSQVLYSQICFHSTNPTNLPLQGECSNPAVSVRTSNLLIFLLLFGPKLENVLSLAKPCCKFSIRPFSLTCPQMCTKRTWSMNILAAVVRLCCPLSLWHPCHLSEG